MSKASVYVLLGPPGSGKGTQAKLLAPKFGLPHISLGDLLRDAVANKTKVGEIAKGYLDAGKLVPDKIAVEVAEEAAKREDCKNGFVVDGFPRTMEQAVLFDEMLERLNFKLTKVIYIDLTLGEILKRLTGRRSCGNCGAVYHVVFNPPKKEGVCDACGAALYQRRDDTEEVIKVRYGIYEKQTMPLIEYYSKAGKLVHINGAGEVNEVFRKVCEAVAA